MLLWILLWRLVYIVAKRRSARLGMVLNWVPRPCVLQGCGFRFQSSQSSPCMRESSPFTKFAKDVAPCGHVTVLPEECRSYTAAEFHAIQGKSGALYSSRLRNLNSSGELDGHRPGGSLQRRRNRDHHHDHGARAASATRSEFRRARQTFSRASELRPELCRGGHHVGEPSLLAASRQARR